MDSVVSCFREIVLADYHSFYLSFPNCYRVLFVLLRVAPVCLLLFYMPRFIKELRKSYPTTTGFSFPQHSTGLVWLLFIIGFLLRLYFVCTTDAVTYGTDAASRFIQAKEWYQDPQGIPGGLIWLPVYHFIILAFTPFGLEVDMSGRLSVLLLSAFSVPLFYTVVRKIFNTSVAFWSAFLLAVNPFHVLYSSLYMSENMFLFLLLCAVYFLLRFLDSGKSTQLLLSSLFINAATLLRYEGWLVAGLLPLFLFFKRKDITLSARYFIFNCIGITIYCATSFRHTGVLIYGLHVSDVDVIAELASRSDKWSHIFSRLSSELVFPVWFYVVLMVGVVYAMVKQYRLAYLFVWLVLFSFTAYKVVTFTSQPFWRYFAASLFMLIPYGAYWLAKVSRNSAHLFAVTFLLLVMLSFPSLNSSYQHRQNLSRTPLAYKEACRLLKTIRKSDEKVILNIRIVGIDHASFQQEVDIHSSRMYQPLFLWMRMFENYEPFTADNLAGHIEDTSFRYIFVQKQMPLDSLLYSTEVTQRLTASGIRLDTLYSKDQFQLLEIKRK